MKKNDYDAIIIGAGIGGLVCGCYLAKAGMKTLIVEKESKAGGYCTSFKRKSFVFDSAVHSFGCSDKDGVLGQIFSDLDLFGKIDILRGDPSDIIVCDNRKIVIRNDVKATIDGYFTNFKKESKALKEFFDLILDSNFVYLCLRLREKTFQEILDKRFSSRELKGVLSIFLGNIGISPSKVSALSAVVLYRNFILNGGYYPRGGMQAFSDKLVDTFIRQGGRVRFNSSVTKIFVNKNDVEGIDTSQGERFLSKYIVSNCDLKHLVLNLLGHKLMIRSSVDKLKKMKPSSSAVVVYLGVDQEIRRNIDKSLGIWRMPSGYNIEKVFLDSINNVYTPSDFVFCAFPSLFDKTIAPKGHDILRLIINAPFKNNNFWTLRKEEVSRNIIKRAEFLVPDIQKYIKFIETATPSTFYRYTLNYQGAICGWLNTPDQIVNSFTAKDFLVKNLFLAGHWAGDHGGHGGIVMVAASGKKAAGEIIKRQGKPSKSI